METVIFQPANDFELSLVKKFIEKTNIKSRVISDEDKEGFVLAKMMQEVDYSETIDTTDFIKGLNH